MKTLISIILLFISTIQLCAQGASDNIEWAEENDRSGFIIFLFFLGFIIYYNSRPKNPKP